MHSLLYLIAAYGICFGLLNDKFPIVPHLRAIPTVDAMLSCAFCTGFHGGWITWGLLGLAEGFPPWGAGAVAQGFAWSISAAILCYASDVWLRSLEARVGE